MRKVREVLRLRWGLGLAIHKVAQSCKVSPSTVLEYERRARAAGLGWPLPEEFDDVDLERLVCASAARPGERRYLPDIDSLLAQMRKPHVTLALLWVEYKAAHPDGYQYTQFWRYYHDAKQKLDVTLRQEHRAGEKLFSDYAGDVGHLTDPHTGELTPVPIFVRGAGGEQLHVCRSPRRT